MTSPESLKLSGISAHVYNAAFGAQFAIHDAISSMNTQNTALHLPLTSCNNLPIFYGHFFFFFFLRILQKCVGLIVGAPLP